MRRLAAPNAAAARSGDPGRFCGAIAKGREWFTGCRWRALGCLSAYLPAGMTKNDGVFFSVSCFILGFSVRQAGREKERDG